ncbi:hypothetical protein BX616_000599 [Lobosporangium transversale]|uniref:Uncharacterized protein n=1 Tax=Lobosporangium transversale TaxID=64571 RepID=A0A1Y2GF07_9FUNG|nr:hypothetical protein BCR41DRAFT_399127 [Lobosporangium transversale]KAF9906840.1 hypothetical protein BX616_000599 [Lobosporangium transversale]ORZ08863.1 hypothetical protein BCR41DRAFT_399127 [Lobosporangium transversale]|eukprot:XP_021878646.1 hypothetical protein BCR41DRAFT_399127 [Lobosporangium transversale]
MVKLTLPLLDNTDNEPSDKPNSTLNCDPSQSIYDNQFCVKDFLFCSDDNPCPSNIPCVDRICQCSSSNTRAEDDNEDGEAEGKGKEGGAHYITLTPPPVRMYTLGCHFDTKREFASCRDYEYGVMDQNQQPSCLLNYCSETVPCYAGRCDLNRHVCTHITSNRKPLPPLDSSTPVITLGDDPFGTQKKGLDPVLIIMLAVAAVVAVALVGCIVRTTTGWTKQTFKWAAGSGGNGKEGGNGSKPSSDEKQNNNNSNINNKAGKATELHGDDIRLNGMDQEGSDSFMSRDSVRAINQNPQKFTGAHYTPSPALGPTTNGSHGGPGGRSSMIFQSQDDSGMISNTPSPLPSPRFPPYSQSNQSHVSNNSLLNPFRNNASGNSGSEGVAIEMNTRTGSPSATATIPEIRTDETARAAAGARLRPGPGPGRHDPRISRSHSALSREYGSQAGSSNSNRISAGNHYGQNDHYQATNSALHKSASMQQLGSRPAPPPPASSSPFNSTMPMTPMIAVSLPPQPSPSPSSASARHSVVMLGPSLSLNSLIHDPVGLNNESGADSPIVLRSQPLPLPSHISNSNKNGPVFDPAALTKSASVRHSLILQSGAERVAALTVPVGQSMLKHSASVPQMFVSSPTSPSSSQGGESSGFGSKSEYVQPESSSS